MDKCTVTVEVYSQVRTFPRGSVAQSLDISAGFSGFQSQPITVEKSAFWPIGENSQLNQKRLIKLLLLLLKGIYHL